MQKLIDFIDSDNIAELLEPEQLVKIAGQVLETFREDWDSMADFRELTDKGLELSKPDTKPRSTPWDGAANFKSTAIISAAIGFGDRASLELLSKEKDLFMLDIIGKDDAKKSKKAKAERIQTYENHCLRYSMLDWVDGQSQLLYMLPAYGTVFKKVYFDPLENRKVSSPIVYPNFVVNQATKIFEQCRAFTELHEFSINKTKEYMALGWWSEIVLDSIDNPDQNSTSTQYLEQHCYLDLDDDGYAEPYIVTIHKETEQICRIVAEFDLDDVMVKMGKVISSLREIEEKGALDIALDTGTLIKINRDMNIVKYGFIKAIDGTFLDFGYYYMLSALTQLINTTTNQLIDGGALANTPSGFLSREHRQRKGDSRFKPGEFKQTDIPAMALQSSILPLPIKEPSQALFMLNEQTKAELATFAASLDMEGLLGSHVSATSALVASQEALIPHSAIMNNILRAQSKEFELLYDLTEDYVTDEEYSAVIGEEASVEEDYSDKNIIRATAQSTMNNVVVEMYRLEALMGTIPTVLQAGGNVMPIINAYIKKIGGVNIDEVFKPMNEEEQMQQSQAMMAQQEKQSQLADLNIAIAQGQVEAFKAEQIAAMSKQENERAELMSKIEERDAKIDNLLASTSKVIAEAESTYIDNQLKAKADMLSDAERKVEQDIKDVDTETPEL